MATKTAAKKAKQATKAAPKQGPGLLARLAKGPVICAEGYLFEFERRGYLQAGAFVPEVVLEHPDLVEGLHRDFVHAGSDVVEAFTYYAHRAKMKIVGRERDLERINRTALRLAKKVARATGTLLAGNICNTAIFGGGRPEVAPAGAPDLRRADRLGGGRRSRLHRRRDLQLGRRGADRARGDPAVGQAGRDHARHPARGADARGVERRRRRPAARGGRRGRGRPQLLPRAGDHAAAAPRDPRAPSAATSGRCRCPYRTTPAEPTFQALSDPQCKVLPGQPAVPGGARPLHLQPLRDRRVRQGRLRPRGPLSRRLLRRRAAPRPEPRGGARAPAAREPLLARHVEAHPLRHGQAASPGQSRVRLDVPAPRGG